MKIIIGILMLLTACWSFWGWCVGESRNYKWMRQWCAGLFVILTAALSAGGGALVAGKMAQSDARRSMSESVIVIREQLAAGQTADVLRELRTLDHQGDPDADAYDILEELPQITQRLRSLDTAGRTASADSEIPTTR